MAGKTAWVLIIRKSSSKIVKCLYPKEHECMGPPQEYCALIDKRYRDLLKIAEACRVEEGDLVEIVYESEHPFIRSIIEVEPAWVPLLNAPEKFRKAEEYRTIWCMERNKLLAGWTVFKIQQLMPSCRKLVISFDEGRPELKKELTEGLYDLLQCGDIIYEEEGSEWLCDAHYTLTYFGSNSALFEHLFDTVCKLYDNSAAARGKLVQLLAQIKREIDRGDVDGAMHLIRRHREGGCV